MRIAFAALALSVAPALSAATARPNILLILTDQQSADAMSCWQGERHIRTPHIDSIAAKGVMFTRAYAANPICVPSRTAMFTGRYPHETGVQNNERHPVDPKRFPTMGTFFRNAGYATGYVGKWHIPIPIGNVAESGFEYTANIKNNGADAATPPAAAEFLARRHDRPFLLVASFVNPHNICEWARGQRLPDGDIGEPPPPEQCPPAPANLAPPKDEPEATGFARASYHANPQFPVGNFDAGKWRQYRWSYYRMIEKVDTEIGRVLAALREHGHADNTLIVLTSDHGDCQGAHGWNQKTVFLDESARVPFIVAPPRAKRTGRSDQLVQTGIDLLPTLCDFTGVATPSHLPGLSMRGAFDGVAATAPDTRRYVVVSNHLVQGMPVLGRTMKPAGRMLRSARYKYCVYDQGERRESLVDMEKDPGELVNLAGNPAFAAVLNEHRRMLSEWSRATGDAGFPIVAPQ
jgi:arylsulfatase A-like enzyme